MQSGQPPEGAIDQAAAQAPATWLEARTVEIEPAAAGRRVVIALSREPEQIQESWLSAPPRLLIDLTGPRPDAPTDVARFPLTDDLVPQVRVGPHGGSLRAVLDFARQPGTHTIRREGMNLIVEVADASEHAAHLSAATPPAAQPAAQAAAKPASTPAPAGSAAQETLAVRDVKLDQGEGGPRLMIDLTRSPDGWKDFVLDNPPRLVIDLKGTPPAQPPRLSRFPLKDDRVVGVRAAWNGSVLRVVVDWHDKVGSYQLTQDGTQLVAKLQNGPVAAIDAPGELFLAPAVVEKTSGAPATGRKSKRVPVGDEFTTTAAAAPEPAPAVAPPPPPAAPAPELAPPPEPTTRRAPASNVVAVPHEKPARPAPRGGFAGQRISLDFKDADIQNVLRVLADVSGLNIIATDDVKGKVTLHLTDVPWDQALDLVMRSNRLEMLQEGNVVRISTVNRLKEEREALRAAQDAERELEPLRVRYVRVNYARADDSLIDKVKGVLTDRGSVTFDERTNTVIVRDISRGVEDASELVRQLDVQSPQVLIEANIVEATESFARALGIQWGYQYNQGPLTGNPTGSNFPGTVGVGGSGLGAGTPPNPAQPGVTPAPVPFIADFPVPSGFNGAFGAGAGSALNLALGSLDGAHTISARLTALEEQGKGRVISRPRVITMNNVAATIQSLTILRVKLPSTGTVINTGTGGAAGTASSATEKINTGITLVVTPQISADGYVLMSIYAKSSQPDFSRTVDGIPNEISREANSNVLIQDGNTVVLGGIFRQTSDDRESGLPYLRRIPALGWLFKRMLKSKQNDELLVFLTPKIVSTGTGALPVAERLWEERRQGG
jgi:type IV pilus assembly protein PilQ